MNEKLKFNNILTATLREASTGKVVQVEQAHNVVTDVGIRLLMDRLGGLTGSQYTAITYGGVGTGTGAAATTDTSLGTEVDRNQATYSRSGNVATFSVFFNTGEANATIWEVGFFGGEATSSINTGTLFDRIKLASSIAKTSSYTLTVEIDITITDT